MPATRRSTRSAAAKGASSKQSTLSFNNRVTKHSVAKVTGKDLASSKPAGKDLSEAAIATVLTPPPTSPPTEKVEEEEEQEQQPVEEEKDEDAVKVTVPATDENPKPKPAEAEVRAEKVTDAQIKKYWRDAENARIAKRVHQEDLSVGEKVLRYFDISSQYGPCIGVDRMKRWYRAERLGLNPPIEVLAVLLKEEKQGNAGIERSTMDRLMESTAVGSN